VLNVGFDDPVTVEYGVTETALQLFADPYALTYTFTGISGPGSLLLHGSAIELNQVLTAEDFQSLTFGPALALGDVGLQFEVSDGQYTSVLNRWVSVEPGMSATYAGSGGSDLLDGGAGNDSIDAFAGNDTILGGTGNDYVNAGNGDDHVDGGQGSDVILGGIGNDVLHGGANSDRLVGGAGIDTLFGEAGNDVFVFNTPLSTANRDIIVDFSNAGGENDTFNLDNAFMPALGAGAQMLRHAFFREGPAARDADDHVIYNPANGALTYDANGDQPGGTTLIAVLINKPHITASDFVVI
jgi:Ca2+-binding RTX toxin-like protein